MIRYYRGKFKVLKLIEGKCPKGKSLYRVLEFGVVGNAKLGYRSVYPNEIITLFVRSCWKKRLT